jgi:endonuclease/exonuclease/phosphatase (EEP) superfamily protein YafD
MLVLTIPWLLLLLLVITVVFLLKKRRKAALLLLFVTFAINWWTDCFCYGFKNTFSGDLKVLTFNVNGQEENDKHKLVSIVSLIYQEEPDIIFLTENYRPLEDSLFVRLNELYSYNTRYMSHNMIYSRYPIHKSHFFDRPNGGSAYITQCYVLSVNGKDLDMYGCHLSSNNYSTELEYLTPNEIDTFEKLMSYLKNINNSSYFRELEADTIVRSLAGNKNVIVMGDMNDIAGSTTMRILSKAGLKDAWSEGGFGYGATIHYPLPYRIDHILYNEGLVLKGVKVIDTSDISDHNALVAVFDFSN